MEQVRTSERRCGRDRRTVGTYLYTGLERRVLEHRRSGFDRRTGWPTVCIYCGKVCGDNRGWTQGISTIETTVECQAGICIDCSPTPLFSNDSMMGYVFLTYMMKVVGYRFQQFQDHVAKHVGEHLMSN